jgi:acyl phosphate:glycerol-3-phosphate acyltransferase
MIHVAPIIVAGACLGAYVVGAIPFGVWLGMRRGIDIRKHGSGNIGFTNAFRVLGAKAGTAVFFLDVAKGAMPALVVRTLWPEEHALAAMVAVAALVGHNWSVFLGFEGGKGISTTLGAALVLSWPAALVAFGCWLLILGLTRYVSLGSLLGAWLLVPLTSLFGAPVEFVTWSVVAACLGTLRHRGNIVRLMRGTERRFGSHAEQTPAQQGEVGEPGASEGGPAGDG